MHFLWARNSMIYRNFVKLQACFAGPARPSIDYRIQICEKCNIIVYQHSTQPLLAECCNLTTIKRVLVPKHRMNVVNISTRTEQLNRTFQTL